MSAGLANRGHRRRLLGPALALSARIPGANALRRSIGALDPIIKQAVDGCFVNGTQSSTFGGRPVGYGAGKCPNLINCIYDGLDSASQAGLSAGTSIACLLPTILALVGAGPIELIQLAFASPIRAIATCMFGVGLPSGLFRQLRTGAQPSGGHSDMRATEDPRVRKWQIYIARPHASKFDIARRILADGVIVTLAGVMLWRNWVIGSVTMITFRCEYSWLLFCWPMACILWLALSCLALYCMAKDIEIKLDDQPRTFWEILILPYRFSPTSPSSLYNPFAPTFPVPQLPMDSPTSTGFSEPRPVMDNRWASSEQQMTRDVYGHPPSPNQLIPQRRPILPDQLSPATAKFRHESYATARTAVGLTAQSFTVTIKMRKEAFWQFYEAGIETVAVGVYLYATIVLGSILFLTGQTGIEYTVLMVLSLAVIRIVGNVM
ncbi:hypothetical protein FIBSPDRAFT_814637 [Athelia psychrophila]|uniref:Uncharacterized protein n=1 Tax=Athelia psychrophila TaxID=1759441 RepID=A0A166TPQ5_9AGAM|nr:hypothetical protein FIBSPDRAFT_814637 [Fibularhizoctonia sp. CBS 109695]